MDGEITDLDQEGSPSLPSFSGADVAGCIHALDQLRYTTTSGIPRQDKTNLSGDCEMESIDNIAVLLVAKPWEDISTHMVFGDHDQIIYYCKDDKCQPHFQVYVQRILGLLRSHQTGKPYAAKLRFDFT